MRRSSQGSTFRAEGLSSAAVHSKDSQSQLTITVGRLHTGRTVQKLRLEFSEVTDDIQGSFSMQPGMPGKCLVFRKPCIFRIVGCATTAHIKF